MGEAGKLGQCVHTVCCPASFPGIPLSQYGQPVRSSFRAISRISAAVPGPFRAISAQFCERSHLDSFRAMEDEWWLPCGVEVVTCGIFQGYVKFLFLFVSTRCLSLEASRVQLWRARCNSGLLLNCAPCVLLCAGIRSDTQGLDKFQA